MVIIIMTHLETEWVKQMLYKFITIFAVHLLKIYIKLADFLKL